MSTAQALRNLELGEDFERDMEEAMHNVVAMKKQPKVERYVAPDPEGDMDRLLTSSRKAIANRQQRIADTKKGLKATLASIAAQKKQAKADFDALMASLAEREVEAKAQADKDIKGDEAYISVCQAALSAAPTE